MTDLDTKHFTRLINIRFLEAVKAVIVDYNISATALGEVLGMTSSNISRLKHSTGELAVIVEALGRMCHFYKVSAFWLLTGLGEMYQNDGIIAAQNSINYNIEMAEKAITGLQTNLKIIKKAAGKRNSK